MLIVALLALTPVNGMPDITVKPSGTGYIAKARTFEAGQAIAVDSKIAQKAAELCAGKDVEWGRFGSQIVLGKQSSATPPKVSGYYKKFRCIIAETRAYLPAPEDWKPSTGDEADVRRFFDSYYAKRDAGEFAAALAMFQPGAQTDPDASTDGFRAFNKKHGSGARRVTAVTWDVNPSAADHPGVYAALDFVGNYPTTHFYCGYLGLYRRGPGSYEIVREEQNIFERNAETPDPAVLAQMRNEYCRGG